MFDGQLSGDTIVGDIQQALGRGRPEFGWSDFCTNDKKPKRKKERNTHRPPANKVCLTRIAEPQSDRSASLAAPECNSPPTPLLRVVLEPSRR
jgi:hypothetical protein